MAAQAYNGTRSQLLIHPSASQRPYLLPGGRDAGLVDAVEDLLKIRRHDNESLDPSLQLRDLTPDQVQQSVVAFDLDNSTLNQSNIKLEL